MNNLKRLLKEWSITQKELSELTKINKDRINRLCNCASFEDSVTLSEYRKITRQIGTEL